MLSPPDSAIHKRSLEAREDVAIKAIVTKHVYNNKKGASVSSGSPNKRPLLPVERGAGKKRRDATDKDGPTVQLPL